MKRLWIVALTALVGMMTACQPAMQPPVGSYEPEWSSLEKHEAVPQWMRDAKFGIYVHWGVFSVPAVSYSL